MTTVFFKSRMATTPYWTSATIYFRRHLNVRSESHLEFWVLNFFPRHRWVLNQCSNMPTTFDDNWSNSEKMATVFRNTRWRRPSFWILELYISDVIDMFQMVVLISTIFGDRSNSKEMAAAHRNPRWRQPPLSPDFCRSKFAGFSDRKPLIVNLKVLTSPEKARASIVTRLLSHRACKANQNFDLWAGRGNGKKKKKIITKP